MTTAAKETEAPERETELDRLAGRLRAALRRESENVVEIGNILIECHEHVPHGGWLAWLAENFRLSYRTARRYECAAEYVAGKSDTVADFGNLSPTVLYNLAGGRGDEDEEAAILAATREGFVDEDAALAICEKLALPDAGDDDVAMMLAMMLAMATTLAMTMTMTMTVTVRTRKSRRSSTGRPRCCRRRRTRSRPTSPCRTSIGRSTRSTG
jgi:hypothetical protein